jgi:hypothetical protein
MPKGIRSSTSIGPCDDTPQALPVISSPPIRFPPNTVRMPLSGRTQRIVLIAQRIDFGQGSSRTVSTMMSASRAGVASPAFSTTANQNTPLPVSRCSHCSSLSRPLALRNP